MRLRSDRHPVAEAVHLSLGDGGNRRGLSEVEGEDGLGRDDRLGAAGGG